MYHVNHIQEINLSASGTDFTVKGAPGCKTFEFVRTIEMFLLNRQQEEFVLGIIFAFK